MSKNHLFFFVRKKKSLSGGAQSIDLLKWLDAAGNDEILRKSPWKLVGLMVNYEKKGTISSSSSPSKESKLTTRKTLKKTNMTMEITAVGRCISYLEIVIFQCHVFVGVASISPWGDEKKHHIHMSAAPLAKLFQSPGRSSYPLLVSSWSVCFFLDSLHVGGPCG